MFYESERIIRKQRRFIDMKARELISDFESKGLKNGEVKAALELSLRDESNTEFRVDVINRAILILTAKEQDEETN